MSWFDSLSSGDMTAMQEGMNFLSAGTKYMADKAQATAREKWQAYSNSMANISNALNQNAISVNETNTVREATDTNANIQKGSILYGAKEVVMASAAGVQGKSVNQSLLDIQANAAQREMNNQLDLTSKLNSFAQQREESEMKAKEAQNYSFIPKPDAGSYLFSAAMQNAKLNMDIPQNDTQLVGQKQSANDIIWNS